MASLYKKPVMVTDGASGQRVKGKSRKWWGQFKDAYGRLKRVPLAVDKMAAEAMLNAIVRKVERERAGLIDPVEEQQKRPLFQHVAEFKGYLTNKGISTRRIFETNRKLERAISDRKWKFLRDINAVATLEFLGQLRRDGLSAQTYNHYLTTLKQFTRWLARERRLSFDPLLHLSRVNVRTDRRHDRRALSAEEFRRLIDAARNGPKVEGISGPDRVMLYILASWTGFRKGEIGSLTLRSLQLDGNPPTATIAASYSKHRRRDTQVLHPELVALLKDWLATKNMKQDVPLFPISGRVPGGIERKTSKMIQHDLKAAREKWWEESKDSDECSQRIQSNFLRYCNHDGLYADFHSQRHRFITNLERAGVSVKMAQTLARHSDVRLTLGVYTHVELEDQTAAIGTLPGPPNIEGMRSPGSKG
jgi:integrase